MHKLINAIRNSLSESNWHSAIFITLTMPDICARLEDPTLKSKQRYINWYSRYLKEIYAAFEERPFLTPSDCYALRCAILHEGTTEIEDKRSREILDEICFMRPDSQGLGAIKPGHCTLLLNVQVNDRHFKSALCLHIDRFCEDMCVAVERWMADVASDTNTQERLSSMLQIY